MEEQLVGEIKKTKNEWDRFNEIILEIEKNIQNKKLVVSDLIRFNDLAAKFCRNLAKSSTLSEMVELHAKVRQLFERVADYWAEEYESINRMIILDGQEPEEARAQMAVVDPLMSCMINMHYVMSEYLPLTLKGKETDTRNILQLEYLSRVKDKYNALIESSIKSLTNPTYDFSTEFFVDDDFGEKNLPKDHKQIPWSVSSGIDISFLTEDERIKMATENSLRDNKPAVLNSTVEALLPEPAPLAASPFTVLSSRPLDLPSSSSEQPLNQENKELTSVPSILELTTSQRKKRKTPGKDDSPPQTPKRPKPSLTDQLTTLLLEFESRMESKNGTNFDLATDCKLVFVTLQKKLKESQGSLLTASRTGSVPDEAVLNWASAMQDLLRLRVALGYLLNYPKNKTAIVNPSLTETLLTLDFFIKKMLLQANHLAQFSKNTPVSDRRLAAQSIGVNRFPNLLLRNLLGRYLAFKNSCDNISKVINDRDNYLYTGQRALRAGELLSYILENTSENYNSEAKTLVNILSNDVTSRLNELKSTMKASFALSCPPAIALNPLRFKYIEPVSALPRTEEQQSLLPDSSGFSSSRGDKEDEIVTPMYLSW